MRKWKNVKTLGVGMFALLIGWATPAADPPESWCGPDSPFGNASTGYSLLVRSGQSYGLTADEDWQDVTVESSATLDTRGYRLRVCGTLTVLPGGTITDSYSGGAGGVGGTHGPYDTVGKGHDPYEHFDCNHQPLCSPGGDGALGSLSPSQPGQNGRGGRGGGGGGGGGGAWWTLHEWDADGGDGGIGGNGGKGGGYVRIYAYRFDNQGLVKANGLPGSAGSNAPTGCQCSPPEVCGPEHCDHAGIPNTDCSGGGGGGGGGGAGGNGGTIEVWYCFRPSAGICEVLGGSGSSGGQSGGRCYNDYGVTLGGPSNPNGCQGGAPNGGDGGTGSHTAHAWSGSGTSGGAGANGVEGDVLWHYICPGYNQSDIDVLRYRLHLELKPDTEEIEGTNIMEILCVSDALTTFGFRLDQRAFGSAVTVSVGSSWNGPWGVLQDWGWGADEKTVCLALDRQYIGGEVFYLRVDYAGAPQSEVIATNEDGRPVTTCGLLFTDHGLLGNPMAYSVVAPWYAYLWWPVKDDGDSWNCDKAIMEELWVTVPNTGAYSAWQVLANGVFDGEYSQGSKKQFRWHTTSEVAAFLVCVAASNFNRYVYSAGNCEITHSSGTFPITLELYIHPEDDLLYPTIKQRWHDWVCGDALKPQQGMIDVFSGLFGLYPFLSEKYGIYDWQNNEYNAGVAMEHQTIVGQDGSRYWLLPHAPDYAFRRAQVVTAHELGHQWWGDATTEATWNDIWLAEGLASYSDALWFENHPYPNLIPGQGALGTLKKYMTGIRMPKQEAMGDTVYRYAVSDPEDVYAYQVVYNKASWVVHMLRHLADSEYVYGASGSFFDLLRKYRETYECALSEDFISLASQYFAEHNLWQAWPADYRNLTWFFGDLSQPTPYDKGGWLYGPGAPAVRYDWFQHAPDHIHVWIKQRQGVFFGEPMFTMPLDVHTRHFGQWTAHPLALWLRASDPSDTWVEHVVQLDDPHWIGELELDRDNWVLTRWISDWIPSGLVDFGLLGTTTEAQMVRIGDESQAVGNARIGDHDRAFLWLAKPHHNLNAGVNDLGTLPGDTDAAAWDINHWGQIVGSSWGSSVARAFIWLPEADYGTAAGMHELDSPYVASWARAVNDAGQAAGDSRSVPSDPATNQAILWQYDWEAGTWDIVELPAPTGGLSCGAHDLNNAGEVIGWYTASGGEKHAVVWAFDDDLGTWQPTDLGQGEAFAVNDSGTVVGYIVSTEGQQTSGQWTCTQRDRASYTWDPILQEARAYAVNDSGQIVGESGDQAFLYLPKAMYGLAAGVHILDTELYPAASCWSFTLGRDINNAGQIVGYGIPAGQTEPHSFLLDLDSLADCQVNGVLDACDIAQGTSPDLNLNGVPDECEILGDANCDGIKDVRDISAFVLALLDPSAYSAAYPTCNIMLADCNSDDVLDGEDIRFFIEILMQGK